MSLKEAQDSLLLINSKIKSSQIEASAVEENDFRVGLLNLANSLAATRQLFELETLKASVRRIADITETLKSSIELGVITSPEVVLYSQFADRLSNFSLAGKNNREVLKSLETLSRFNPDQILTDLLVAKNADYAPLDELIDSGQAEIQPVDAAVLPPEEPEEIEPASVVPSVTSKPLPQIIRRKRPSRGPMAARVAVFLGVVSVAGVFLKYGSPVIAQEAIPIFAPAPVSPNPSVQALQLSDVFGTSIKTSTPDRVALRASSKEQPQKPVQPKPQPEKPKTELKFPQMEITGMPEGTLKVGQKVTIDIKYAPSNNPKIRFFTLADLNNTGKWIIDEDHFTFTITDERFYDSKGNFKPLSVAMFAEVNGKTVSGPEIPFFRKIEKPAELQIAQKAKEIASRLSKGGNGLLNKYAAEPGVYFWCTDLVIRSYNSSGIAGLTRGQHLSVVNMRNFFEKTRGFAYTPVNQKAIENLRPGDAIFFGPDHVGLAGDVNIVNGSGTIQLIHSNGATAIDTIQVRNYQLSQPRNLLMSVTGFGQRTR